MKNTNEDKIDIIENQKAIIKQDKSTQVTQKKFFKITQRSEQNNASKTKNAQDELGEKDIQINIKTNSSEEYKVQKNKKSQTKKKVKFEENHPNTHICDSCKVNNSGADQNFDHNDYNDKDIIIENTESVFETKIAGEQISLEYFLMNHAPY